MWRDTRIPGRVGSEDTARVAARCLTDEGQEVVEVFVPANQPRLLRLVGREASVRLPRDVVFAACWVAKGGEELCDG